MPVQPDDNGHLREMIVRFRLYDDGVGFRYEWPAQDNFTYFTIKEERTEFAMTGTTLPIGFRATTTLRNTTTP